MGGGAVLSSEKGWPLELASGLRRFGGEEKPLCSAYAGHDHLAPRGPTSLICLSSGGKPEAQFRPQSMWYGEQSALVLCQDNSTGTLRLPHPAGPLEQWAQGQGLMPRALIPDDSSSESGSGNGSSTLNPSTSSSTQGDPAFPEMNGNGAAAPMDFTAAAEDQPINLCDKLPPGTALGTPSYPSDGCSTDGLRSRVKYGVKSTPEVCGAAGRVPLGSWEAGGRSYRL